MGNTCVAHLSSGLMGPSSSLNLYWKPEHPPPSTSIRRAKLLELPECRFGDLAWSCFNLLEALESIVMESDRLGVVLVEAEDEERRRSNEETSDRATTASDTKRENDIIDVEQ